ncbi:MAG TPA: thioredoxin domain-containing protein [Puia sp.]|nr:thioredoxin domain-containing protein [Puia sp.]
MNRLAQSSSPYLLQHAENPVDWFPWGDEAFAKARIEDKPVLVSIGYSACHWCHVMERESFEDAGVAEIMNRHFVNIKVDREERPDLDHIYMEAVQALTGQGGWPLNVFLTPEGKPFYGGTYYPPADVYNRPSWRNILQRIAEAYRNQRMGIFQQADNLTAHIARTNSLGVIQDASSFSFGKEQCETAFENLMKTADMRYGGFGAAPKFPQTFSIRFLLQHFFYTRNETALTQACLSLDSMIYGGINDQLGGGFARYSTDAEWLAPHFEKMLYDNALIIMAMAEAYQLTGKTHYREAILRTVEFLLRELYYPEGGFESALDADSEGEEGKYYVWEKEETDRLLGDLAPAFSRYYDISEEGNWEGKNILRVKDPGVLEDPGMMGHARDILLKARQGRIPPRKDDKILLGWNALAITAFCKAYAALGLEELKATALTSIEFLENRFQGSGIYRFFHSFKKGQAAIPAFLDDYANLIECYIQLQEITGNTIWLKKASGLTDWVIAHFGDPETPYFFYTHEDQDDVIVRKKEVYDGAVPSGNAIMAANLLYLGIAMNRPEWKKRSAELCNGMSPLMLKYPGSFGIWATLLNAFSYGMNEIVLGGGGADQETKHREFLARFIPNRVFQLTSSDEGDFPLLRNKPVSGTAQFFLCRDYACQQPVKELNELLGLLNIP